MSVVRIEPASSADLAAVAALEAACYADPWAPGSFQALPGDPRVFFAVARRKDGGAPDILGYVVAWFVMDEGELANLAVAPGARRQGVARTLLEAVLEEAGRRQIRDLFLEVRESNGAALRLYTVAGFEQIGRREGYYRHPEEAALVLRRRIETSLKQHVG